jgi:hypothetical protein
LVVRVIGCFIGSLNLWVVRIKAFVIVVIKEAGVFIGRYQDREVR